MNLIKDEHARAFMDAMLDAVTDGTLKVNEWERKFLSGTKKQDTFSKKQKECVEKMLVKYQDCVTF